MAIRIFETNIMHVRDLARKGRVFGRKVWDERHRPIPNAERVFAPFGNDGEAIDLDHLIEIEVVDEQGDQQSGCTHEWALTEASRNSPDLLSDLTYGVTEQAVSVYSRHRGRHHPEEGGWSSTVTVLEAVFFTSHHDEDVDVVALATEWGMSNLPSRDDDNFYVTGERVVGAHISVGSEYYC